MFAQVHALLELFDEAAGTTAEPATAAAADTVNSWDAGAALQQPPRKRQRTGGLICIFVTCSHRMDSAVAVHGRAEPDPEMRILSVWC